MKHFLLFWCYGRASVAGEGGRAADRAGSSAMSDGTGTDYVQSQERVMQEISDMLSVKHAAIRQLGYYSQLLHFGGYVWLSGDG